MYLQEHHDKGEKEYSGKNFKSKNFDDHFDKSKGRKGHKFGDEGHQNKSKNGKVNDTTFSID